MFECRRCFKRFEGGSGCVCFTLCEECGEIVERENTLEVVGLK
jgi:hypothetical protein